MHTSVRTRPIHKIVIHTNEGPEGDNSASGLRNYLLRNGDKGGGYQAVFDDRNTVVVVGDDVECWANGAINGESVDGCIIGYAAQTQLDWADLFDAGDKVVPGAIEEAAQWVASKCRAYGIPPVLLTSEQTHDPNAKGITTHGGLTAAGYSGTMGHTDPGSNFPLERFIDRVVAILSPPIDWAYLAKLDRWEKRVRIRPLRLHDKGGDVEIMCDLLVAHKVLKKSSRRYSLRVAAAVRHFKKIKRFKTAQLDGRHFGSMAAAAILRP